MTIIWHDHHIIPKHRGGTDDPSNIRIFNLSRERVRQIVVKWG
jgi:hypothetical protein